MTYRLTYRRVKASDITNTISPDQIPLLSQPTRVGIPNFSYIRNKRDNDLESTKGNYTTIDGGVASTYFGSETDFGRMLIQNSTYYAFGKNRGRKFVLARSTRIGVENPYGRTFMPSPGAECDTPVAGQQACLPLAERFFSGGGNSLRGFGLNQAGPRDPTTGFPLGGTGLFINNLELRTPPPTLPFFQDNMSFAFFHDAGNVFTNAHDMFHNLLQWRQRDPDLCLHEATAKQCDYNYISHAIGVGVRYKTPVGPVRFDFGYNLNPPAFPGQTSTTVNGKTVTVFDPEHASHFNVYFSIGQTFLMTCKLPAFICTVALLTVASLSSNAEVIDRIVASVNGHVILQSDWEDALRYEAFSSGRPLDRLTADDRKAALDRLIDQELLREQLQAPDSSHASAEDIDQRVAEIRKQYPNAESEPVWLAILHNYGLTPEELQRRVATQLDLMSPHRFPPPTRSEYRQQKHRKLLSAGIASSTPSIRRAECPSG